ncbi:MAG: hypothetical protein II004_05885 [Erysipelotrichaceae bacterium]|nr:hypothetical protein [Erysipelotrichaceae bacterium]
MDLTNSNDIHSLLQRYGFHFSKALGQNFLIASWVPKQIAESSMADYETGVLEIGPGIGCLTEQLSLRAGKVVALEVDRRLQPLLRIPALILGIRRILGILIQQGVNAQRRAALPANLAGPHIHVAQGRYAAELAGTGHVVVVTVLPEHHSLIEVAVLIVISLFVGGLSGLFHPVLRIINIVMLQSIVHGGRLSDLRAVRIAAGLMASFPADHLALHGAASHIVGAFSPEDRELRVLKAGVGWRWLIGAFPG